MSFKQKPDGTVQIDVNSQPGQPLITPQQGQAPTSNGQMQQITNTTQGTQPSEAEENPKEASRATLDAVIAKLDLKGRDDFYTKLITLEIHFWK